MKLFSFWKRHASSKSRLEFQSLVQDVKSEIERKAVVKPRRAHRQYDCPCCRYPTLKDRGAFSLCLLCFWEDDGQDDPYADELWAGPNGDFTLNQARATFRKFLVMYSPEEDYRLGGADTAEEKAVKQKILDGFARLREPGPAKLSLEEKISIYFIELKQAMSHRLPAANSED